jgi:hypothetical protein
MSKTAHHNFQMENIIDCGSETSLKSPPVSSLRFALLVTNDVTLARWQIHTAECTSVMKMVRNGAFAQFLSADSAEAIRQVEVAIHGNHARTATDFKIMPCCRRE